MILLHAYNHTLNGIGRMFFTDIPIKRKEGYFYNIWLPSIFEPIEVGYTTQLERVYFNTQLPHETNQTSSQSSAA